MSYVPYSTIGVITAYHEDGTISQGTGFLIGPNDVATAAHVIAREGITYFTFMFPNGTSLSLSELKKGNRISVYFNGIVRETAPAEIRDVFKIQLLDDMNETGV